MKRDFYCRIIAIRCDTFHGHNATHTIKTNESQLEKRRKERKKESNLRWIVLKHFVFCLCEWWYSYHIFSSGIQGFDTKGTQKLYTESNEKKQMKVVQLCLYLYTLYGCSHDETMTSIITNDWTLFNTDRRKKKEKKNQ